MSIANRVLVRERIDWLDADNQKCSAIHRLWDGSNGNYDECSIITAVEGHFTRTEITLDDWKALVEQYGPAYAVEENSAWRGPGPDPQT